MVIPIPALRRFANARLTVHTQSEFLKATETGNLVPITNEVIVLAVLKPKNLKQEKLTGGDITVCSVEGFFVDSLPVGASTPIKCNAKIDGYDGLLEIPLLIKSPYNTPTRIQGIFTVQG